MTKDNVQQLAQMLREDTLKSKFITSLRSYLKDESEPLYDRFQMYLDVADLMDDSHYSVYKNPIFETIFEINKEQYPYNLARAIYSGRERHKTYSAVEDLLTVLGAYIGEDMDGCDAEYISDEYRDKWKEMFDKMPDSIKYETRYPHCTFVITKEQILNAINEQVKSMVYDYKMDW